MAQIIVKNINGVKFEFVNNYRANRSGFVHETQLFRDNQFMAEDKAQYYNRTWECYTYQSVMKSVVYNLLENCMENFKNSWKEKHGIKRLTAGKKEQMTADFVENPPAEYLELRALHASL